MNKKYISGVSKNHFSVQKNTFHIFLKDSRSCKYKIIHLHPPVWTSVKRLLLARINFHRRGGYFLMRILAEARTYIDFPLGP